VKHSPLPGIRFFFSTPPMPCPYLPGHVERRLVTELAGRDADRLHDNLSRAGFRRSHGIAYAPACPHCSACLALRVVVDAFVPSRSQRRTWRRNGDLEVTEKEAIATTEQYALFETYQRTRHGDGDMARMDFFDYRALIEDTSVRTAVAEFRDADGTLIGACLTDVLNDGLSAVYSFFDPEHASRSLGTMMILWLIRRAREKNLPYAYLGFWIAQSDKMAYKAAFRPAEIFSGEGWNRLVAPEAAADES